MCTSLAFLMPLNRIFSSYLIGLLIINWLLEARFISRAKSIVRSHRRIDTFLFSGLFIVYLIGMLYTDNQQEGWFSVQVKLSLIVFPILFATSDVSYWTIRRVRLPLIAFVAGSFLSSLICLGMALQGYNSTGNSDLFYYINLSYFHHPGYMAMYISFATAILISYLIQNKGLWKNRWRLIILNLLLILYFSIFVVLLSSKAGIITLVLIFFLSVSFIVFVQRKYKQGLLLMVLISITLATILNVFPYSANRFNIAGNVMEQSDLIDESTTEGTVERILIWRYSIDLMNDNFFFGVGTGDVTDALVNLYQERDFIDASEKKLNAHNQYIQTFLALGLVGFIVLLLSLLLPAIFSVVRRQFIYFCFLVIVGFNFLIESMLLRQAGVVFYAFFNAFLFAVFYLPGNKRDETK